MISFRGRTKGCSAGTVWREDTENEPSFCVFCLFVCLPVFLIHIHSAVPQHTELAPGAETSAFWREVSGEIVLNRSTLGRLHCHRKQNKEQDRTPVQSVSVAYPSVMKITLTRMPPFCLLLYIPLLQSAVVLQ